MHSVQQRWESYLCCLNIKNSRVKMVSERLMAEERFLFFLRQFSYSIPGAHSSCLHTQTHFFCTFADSTRDLDGFEMKGKIPQWLPEEAGLPQPSREILSFFKCKHKWYIILTGNSLWPIPASVLGLLRAQQNWGYFCWADTAWGGVGGLGSHFQRGTSGLREEWSDKKV